MGIYCKRLILAFFAAALMLQLSGCGETFQGIGKDTRRVGQGIKTIFVRDGE